MKNNKNNSNRLHLSSEADAIRADAIHVVKSIVSVRVGGVMAANATSLIFDANLDEAELIRIANEISATDETWKTAMPFYVGDLLVAANNLNGESLYPQIAAILGYEVGVLRNMKWTAGAVKPESRRVGASYTHHRAVASLDDADQVKFLEQSILEGWTVTMLRDAVERFKGVQKTVTTITESTDDDKVEVAGRKEAIHTTISMQQVLDFIIGCDASAVDEIVKACQDKIDSFGSAQAAMVL